MHYLEILSRALAISWRHKYLWLLAIFAGEATTTSLSFQSGSANRSYNGTSGQAVWNQFTSWAGIHATLLWSAAAVLAALCIVLFVVSAVANGALVRAGAEHDADRPFGLREAWSAGLRTFWPVLGLKAFALVVNASLVIIIGGLGIMAVVFASSGDVAMTALTAMLAGVLLLAGIPFFIVFSVAVVLGVRAIVLDGKGASDGLGTALTLMRRRPGRVALFWLLVLVAGVVASIVAGLALVLAAVPVMVVAIGSYLASGWLLALATGLGLGAAWLIVLITFVGGVNAFTSTSWTVAYPRFDAEALPAVSTQPHLA